jgi:FkbM family methyltransferase
LQRGLFAPCVGAVLVDPWVYRKAFILKFIRGVHKHPIALRMRIGFVVNVREFVSLFIFREIFLDRCYDMELPAAPIVLDVGANTGMFAIRAKQLWPDSTIYCYEPHPANFERLKETITQNSLDLSVRPYQEGVGGSQRDAKLYVNGKNIGGHSVLDSKSTGAHVPIKLVDLQEALRRTPKGRCDLLKLDCEGAEHEIIMAINDAIAERIPRIIYEYSAGATGPEAKRHLQSLGYRITTKGELFSAVRISSQ